MLLLGPKDGTVDADLFAVPWLFLGNCGDEAEVWRRLEQFVEAGLHDWLN